jgi:CRP-like cAMP-binding protein
MRTSRLTMLRATPIFGGLRDDVLGVLLDNARETRVDEGAFLFVENEPGDALYVLESGRVAILKRWDGFYYRLNYLGVGDCIGEMSAIDLGRRSASVLAMTECHALEVTHAALLRLYEYDLEQFALMQMNLGRELSRRLRIADEALFQELIKADELPQH